MAHLLRLLVISEAVKYFWNLMTADGSCKYRHLIHSDILVIDKLETEEQIEPEILKNDSGSLKLL